MKYFFNILFIFFGAFLFSSGLSFRLPKHSVPKEILERNGTRPGLILGTVLVLLGCFTLYFSQNKILSSIAYILTSIGIGGLSFAIGATNLAIKN